MTKKLKIMSKKIGLWIDRRKAVILQLSGGKEGLEIVESKIEGRPRVAGGSPSITPYGPNDAVAEDRLERKYKSQLSRYYDDVLSNVRDAEAIYIFGPGEAKIEFRKYIESKEPRAHIVGVETADKMTENQIKSNVRRFFDGRKSTTN